VPYWTIRSCRRAWLSGRCRSSIRAPYTCCQDGPITPAIQPGAATAAPPAPPAASPRQLQPFSSRIAPHVGGIGALPPAALTRRGRQALQQRIQRQHVRSPATAGPELAQHAGIKARILQLQAERGYFHVIRCGRIGGLPVVRSQKTAGHWPSSAGREIPAGPGPRTRREPGIGIHLAPAHRGSASPGSPAGTTNAPSWP